MNAEMRRRTEEQIDELQAELDVPRNADGDSIDDMQAVQERLKVGAVEAEQTDHTWFSAPTLSYIFDAHPNSFRIAAKHADKFDHACMDFETWARAVIARGMVIESVGNFTTYFGEMYRDEGIGRSDAYRMFADGYESKNGVIITYTAITPAQYAEETAPEPKWYKNGDCVYRDAGSSYDVYSYGCTVPVVCRSMGCNFDFAVQITEKEATEILNKRKDPKLYTQAEADNMASDAVLEFADKIAGKMEELTK